MTGMSKKNNYSTEFFGKIRGDFSKSPQEYQRSFRNAVGAPRSFIGPWDYAGIATNGLRSRRDYITAQEESKSTKVQRGGFLSADKLTTKKRKVYEFGENHTDALGDE